MGATKKASPLPERELMGSSNKRNPAPDAAAVKTGGRQRWITVAFLGVCLFLVVVLLLIGQLGPGNAATDWQRLCGRWDRTDGKYLEIRSVAADGKVEASYFNPNPIHVAEARAEREGGTIQLLVKLQDVGYPGSTYTLTYDPLRDELSGAYFSAATEENFQVTFVREK
jgi:hypothetical protein